MFWWFAESAGVAQVEDLAANLGAEGSTVQTLTEEPDVARFAVSSVAVDCLLYTSPSPRDS